MRTQYNKSNKSGLCTHMARELRPRSTLTSESKVDHAYWSEFTIQLMGSCICAVPPSTFELTFLLHKTTPWVVSINDMKHTATLPY